ncbi:MAG: hypothetical protein LBQ34_02105 [Alphaproteobacteria bacterium]|jgi:hypothetical protein|nr:hypothetical protein [Alphaproteobacteria bacterium]
MKFFRKFTLLILTLFFILPFALNVNAEDGDYAAVNLKYFSGYIDSNVSYLDTWNHFVEVETMAKKGQWDIYGFTDFKFQNQKYNEFNYDFYKYIVRYDVLDNSRFFLVAQTKETFMDHKGNAFLGLGTSFNLPVIGTVNSNAMYFLSSKDAHGEKIEIPAMIQFSWFNNFGNIGDTQLNWYHGGWSDLDLYEKRKDKPNTNASFQIYEGVGVNYNTYAMEVGYKYWKNVSGIKRTSANSVFAYLIKRF